MGSVEIYILGQKYTIKGEESDEYIQALSTFVKDRIKKVYDNSPNITPLKASILAAINIADELHRLKHEQEHISKSLEEKTVTLTRLFE